jgi:hypothetical protein
MNININININIKIYSNIFKYTQINKLNIYYFKLQLHF